MSFEKYIDIINRDTNYQEYPNPTNFIIPFQDIIYSGSISGKSESVIYYIQLLDLQIANEVLLRNGGDTLLSDYSYLYVVFGNPTNITNCMYSNNQYGSKNAIFKVPIPNNINPTDSYINLSCNMVQSFRFKPDTDYKFSLKYADGEPVEFKNAPINPPIPIDGTPPVTPFTDPNSRVSATIGIKQANVHDNFFFNTSR